MVLKAKKDMSDNWLLYKAMSYVKWFMCHYKKKAIILIAVWVMAGHNVIFWLWVNSTCWREFIEKFAQGEWNQITGVPIRWGLMFIAAAVDLLQKAIILLFYSTEFNWAKNRNNFMGFIVRGRLIGVLSLTHCWWLLPDRDSWLFYRHLTVSPSRREFYKSWS